MAAITKNVLSNQFSISFPVMSCYLLKMTKILYVVQNDNCSYNCVGESEVNTGNVSAVWR